MDYLESVYVIIVVIKAFVADVHATSRTIAASVKFLILFLAVFKFFDLSRGV